MAYVGTSASTTIPLSALGADEGSMNFKVASVEQLTTNSTSTIRDYMPDLRALHGVVSVPEPGTLALLGIGLLGLARRWR